MDWFAIGSLKMDLCWAGQEEATPNPENGFKKAKSVHSIHKTIHTQDE